MKRPNKSWDIHDPTGGTCQPPDTHKDNRPIERFRPMSQAEQDEEEMEGWTDANSRYLWGIDPHWGRP